VRAQAALADQAGGGDEAARDVVHRALEEPFRQIATNAGDDEEEALRELRRLPAAFGLDARTGEYVDMFQAGLIDATFVLRVALEHAGNTVGRFLSII
jgi:chaperonin GroEL